MHCTMNRGVCLGFSIINIPNGLCINGIGTHAVRHNEYKCQAKRRDFDIYTCELLTFVSHRVWIFVFFYVNVHIVKEAMLLLLAF